MTLDQNKIIAVGLEELMSKSYDMVLYRLKKRKVNNAPEADYLRSVMEIQKMKDVFETVEQLERENPGIYEEWMHA